MGRSPPRIRRARPPRHRRPRGAGGAPARRRAHPPRAGAVARSRPAVAPAGSRPRRRAHRPRLDPPARWRGHLAGDPATRTHRRRAGGSPARGPPPGPGSAGARQGSGDGGPPRPRIAPLDGRQRAALPARGRGGPGPAAPRPRAPARQGHLRLPGGGPHRGRAAGAAGPVEGATGGEGLPCPLPRRPGPRGPPGHAVWPAPPRPDPLHGPRPVDTPGRHVLEGGGEVRERGHAGRGDPPYRPDPPDPRPFRRGRAPAARRRRLRRDAEGGAPARVRSRPPRSRGGGPPGAARRASRLRSPAHREAGGLRGAGAGGFWRAGWPCCAGDDAGPCRYRAAPAAPAPSNWTSSRSVAARAR